VHTSLILISVVCLSLLTPAHSLVGRINLTEGGPEVSRMAWGTLHLAEAPNVQTVLSLIENALSLGIITFDLSDVYGGNEKCMKLVGQALALKPGLRSKMEIIAKMDVGNGYDTSPEHLQQILNDYLAVLQTDYVDLVLLHRQDYLMDVGEVSQLFRQWKTEGKVRYFGTSNHEENSFLNLHARIPLVTNEIEASVWAPETIAPVGSGPISPDNYFTNSGLVEFHYRLNMSVLAWGPLGGDPYGGINRLFKMTGNRQTAVRKALQALGQQLNDLEDVVGLAWLMKHPANIVPIIGTLNPERMTNQTRAEQLSQKMTRKQWYDIARAVGVPLP